MFAAAAALVTTLAAQGMPGGGGMPDAKQMSGMPLPVGDVAPGTVTVRVIKGSLANPLKGEVVELVGPAAPLKGVTNDTGRAEFANVPVGTRVKAVAIVPERYIETAQTLGASRWQIIRKVLVPLALPDIITSLRFQLGLGPVDRGDPAAPVGGLADHHGGDHELPGSAVRTRRSSLPPALLHAATRRGALPARPGCRALHANASTGSTLIMMSIFTRSDGRSPISS